MPNEVAAAEQAAEQVRLFDLSLNDPILKVDYEELWKKMVHGRYRLRLHKRKHLMSLYKKFARSKSAKQCFGMWTRKVGESEWYVQARLEHERRNPLRDISRNYSNPSYSYGRWKGLAQQLAQNGYVMLEEEAFIRRVIAAYRHYCPEGQRDPDYAPFLLKGSDYAWLLWVGQEERPAFLKDFYTPLAGRVEDLARDGTFTAKDGESEAEAVAFAYNLLKPDSGLVAKRVQRAVHLIAPTGR